MALSKNKSGSFLNKSGSFLLSSTVDVDAQFRRWWAFGIDYVLAHQLSLSEKEKQFSILIFPSYIFPSNFSEKGTLESTVSLPLNAVLLELPYVFAFQLNFSRDDICAFECSSFRILPPPFFGFRIRQRLQRKLAIDLVGSIKLYVSFAKEPYKRANILQKRPKSPRMHSVIFLFSSFFFPLLPGLIIVGKKKTMSSPMIHFF